MRQNYDFIAIFRHKSPDLLNYIDNEYNLITIHCEFNTLPVS